MSIWGGLTKRQDGKQILQIYVNAEDVQLLIDRADRWHYNLYTGDELELDIPVKGEPIAEVWLCVVPDDRIWPS